ncbi:MAG: biotin-dependent carboxyltransferase family protein [Flammeovirgaceae bacterium]|nr:biotin-dependent carboxyltransferase family protein [Flammeovirgaceae bacterium]
MTGHITVLSPGLLTSIQDVGRPGFRKYGVPRSGVMDEVSSSMANMILNNSADDAVLEITLSGPQLQFSGSTSIAISGADLSPRLNMNPILINKPYKVIAGDVLSFGKANYGVRSYLSVKGGFQVEQRLGSRSFYKPITGYNRLNKGDQVMFITTNDTSVTSTLLKPDINHFEVNKIDVFEGPEFHLLSSASKQLLNQSSFKITNDNNRMGYRLLGEPVILKSSYNMLTSAVLPGTVQCTPAGGLIILMRDCQTTGGYPRILQLADHAISQLSQKGTGDSFGFTIVNLN